MEPCKVEKQKQTAPLIRKQEPKPRLQIVKLEERIAPRLAMNHNESQIRDLLNGKPTATKVHKEEQKRKLQIVKLEERIAPGIRLQNHNETLIRDRA